MIKPIIINLMKRDENGLHFAQRSSYKYLHVGKDGKILGYGITRQTLTNHGCMPEEVMTIRQYIKATKEVQG